MLCFSFSCQTGDLCTSVLFLFNLFKQTKLFIFAEPDQFKPIQELSKKSHSLYFQPLLLHRELPDYLNRFTNVTKTCRALTFKVLC